MKYFYDTEFLDDGKTIELISFAIVAEDGREYYAVNADADWDLIATHSWLCDNVVPHLPLVGGDVVKKPPRAGGGHRFWIDTRHVAVRPRFVIRNEIREFLAGDPDVELWGYYAAYDHVVLAQMFGPMVELPEHIPMYTHDIMQLGHALGAGRPPIPNHGRHDALADARWTRDVHAWLTQIKETTP